jgi:hypothetical protein
MEKINYKRISKLFILAMILLLPFCYVLAGDQIKSNIFLVDTGSKTNQISSAVDLSVSFYIGNDLSGVSNSVKRAIFRVSGVYTGGGTIQFKIDSDNTSAKTFTLPSVSKATDFELIYRDDSGKINPTSAGTYNRTLNVLPSGVTISGLAAKLEITYQFAPSTCIDGASANEKVKTTEFYVGQLTAPLSSETYLPFSVYIGDDLTGITNPVKSVYFLVSGVYSGSGTLALDTDAAGPTQTNTLPNSATKANFSFIYKDTSGRISPTSAGTYNYSLHVVPSGVTISNLSVKAVLTHRYKPVSCGVGYPPYGDLVSSVYDFTNSSDGPAYNSIMWKGILGGTNSDEGKVKFQVAASDSSSGPWNDGDYVGGSTCSSGDWYDSTANTAVELGCYSQLNNKRYFRYKVRICSNVNCVDSGTATPQIYDIIVNWAP